MRFITFTILLGLIGSAYADTIRCYFPGRQEWRIIGRVTSHSYGYYFVYTADGKTFSVPISACTVEYG